VRESLARVASSCPGEVESVYTTHPATRANRRGVFLTRGTHSSVVGRTRLPSYFPIACRTEGKRSMSVWGRKRAATNSSMKSGLTESSR